MARRAGRKLKFATVGFTRDTEKKYADMSMVSPTWLPEVISYEATPGTPATAVVQGMKFMSNLRVASGNANTNNNLVAWVSQGTSATARVGNKVKGLWIDLGVTLEAAKSPLQQFGEQLNPEGAVVSAEYYMKTNYRVVVVKDLQVNNNTGSISWGDVFGAGSSGVDGTYFGSADKLDIPNMGRFRVLKDVRCTVDAENPLMNKKIVVGNIGDIRYNGAPSPSLTDKGYYILIAQDVLGTATSAAYVKPGNVRVGTRFAFVDL